MIPQRKTAIELMALADGELEGPERVHAESVAASDPDARRIVDAMRDPVIGGWLAETIEAKASAVGLEGVADAVLARIARDRRLDPVAAPIPLRRRLKSHPRMALGAMGAALVLAATVTLFLRRDTSVGDSGAAMIGRPPSGTANGAHPSVLGRGVEVDDIDSPGRGISVYEISATVAAAAETARPASIVIWIDGEPAKP